jgi:hypothetical protein
MGGFTFGRRAWLCLGLVGCVAWSVPARGAEPVAAKALPKVLILGDSISLGYTPVVNEMLAGQAEVLRPATNCQHSGFGAANVQKWVGTTRWDVIHFNFGIWDTHMLDEKNQIVRDEAGAKGPLHIRHTPEQYRKNLEAIIAVLEATGAKLIFANTTPIMSRKGERFEAIPKLNATAAALMAEKQIPVNNLYDYVLPNAKAWQGGDKVHFTAEGSKQLGRKVSDEILSALTSQKKN